MKLLLKTLVILALIVLPLTSCISQQRPSRHQQITRDFLLKLETGKDYLLELKSGATLEIYLQDISPERISGFSYYYESRAKVTIPDYSDTFETIEKNVARITLLKREPLIYSKAVYVPTPPSPEVSYKPEELIKIQKFQKMKKAGFSITLLGGLAVTAGVISAMAKSTDSVLSGESPDTHTEEVIIGVGMLAVVPGVTLMCLGTHKERKYKKELQGASIGLGLNPYRPGLSLKIRF